MVKVETTLSVTVRAQFDDEISDEDTVKYLLEQDLEGSGWDCDVELLRNEKEKLNNAEVKENIEKRMGLMMWVLGILGNIPLGIILYKISYRQVHIPCKEIESPLDPYIPYMGSPLAPFGASILFTAINIVILWAREDFGDNTLLNKILSYIHLIEFFIIFIFMLIGVYIATP